MAERPESEPDGSAPPEDSIDPELVALPRSRPRVGILLAASIVVGCAFLMFTLRGDVRFSMAGAPEKLTVADAAQSGPAYIEIEAIPDRTLVATVSDSPGDFGGYRLAPVLGAGDKLWIALDRDPWSAPEDYDRVYTGRLEVLDDVAFGDALAAWVAKQPPTPRPITADALRQAVADPSGHVTTPSGGSITVGAQTPIAITEIVPGRARVTGFSSSVATEAEWNTALTEAGILAPGAAPVSHTESSWTYEVDAPAGVEAIRATLAEAKLFGAIAEPLSRTHFGHLGDLEAASDSVVIGDAEVAWSTIDAVLLLVPRAIPEDARVLIAGESPSDYVLVLPAFILLAGFLALFGWSFWRTLRRELRSAGRATP